MAIVEAIGNYQATEPATGGIVVRSIENPNVDLNDPDNWPLFGVVETETGVTVNADTALGLDGFWRGVNLLSQSTAKLPLPIYRRLDNGGKLRAKDHPGYRLLMYQPMPELSAFNLLEVVTQWAIVYGNGYVYIRRDGRGNPIELLPLHPTQTTPVRLEGVLWYVYEMDGSQPFRFPWSDVIHIRGLTNDGLIGYSVIDMLRQSLGMAVAERTYAGKYFKNSGRPAVILEAPGRLNEKQINLIKTQWQSMYTGVDNAHRTAILDMGMKAHAVGMSAEDMQLLESRTFSLIALANILNLPPHKLGHPTRTAYSSLEQENQSYLDESLDPWLKRWESECWIKILSEEEKRNDSHTIEFVRQALVRADLSTRVNAYAVMINHRIMNPNEARIRENMNPYDGGDDFIGGAGNPQGSGDQRSLEIVARQALSEAVTRASRRLAVHTIKLARDARRFVSSLETLTTHAGQIRDMLTVPAALLSAIREVDVDPQRMAAEILQRWQEGLLELSGQCRAAELESRVQVWADSWILGDGQELIDQFLRDDHGTTIDQSAA